MTARQGGDVALPTARKRRSHVRQRQRQRRGASTGYRNRARALRTTDHFGARQESWPERAPRSRSRELWTTRSTSPNSYTTYRRFIHISAPHDVVTVTFSLGLLRSMASPTSTNSLSARQSLDWPLWSGHFPASLVRRKGSSGLVVGHAEAGAVYVLRTKPPLAPTKRRA